MTTILFIHGTGVRGTEYDISYKLIAERIEELGHVPAKCLWGDKHGSKFDGAALPSYLSEQERENIAIWRMLLQDPFAELRLLETTPDATGLITHGEILWQKFLTGLPGERTYQNLQLLGLAPFWPYAFDQLAKDPEHHWQKLVERAAQNDGQFELALSRCLVARLIRSAEEQWLLPPTGGDRDLLVASIQDDLGGAPRGLLGDVLKRVSGLFTPIATPLLRWTRDSWSAGVSPAIGDILMYQARGKDVRDCIKTEIEAQQGPVVVLAHSLGGIAAVDLLLTTDIPQVQALVTVGSQSPYLYGINALTGLEKGRPWPNRFPRNWLNVYDINDFLSYPGAGILPGRVKDFSPSYS